MTTPQFENLKLEISEGIAVLTVNRPKVLNALNEATLRELETAFNYIEACMPGYGGPNRVDLVIFTGSGEKSFIAGADILEMKDRDIRQGEEFARLGQRVTMQMEAMPQPIIAAVNGFALGGGCEFAMACDFILAAENAIFGQPEVGIGVIPGFGGCLRLPRYIGLAKAKEYIYSGKKWSAEEAKNMGMVLDVVPANELMMRAMELAKKIQANSPLAVSKAKKAIDQMYVLPTESALRVEAELFGSIFGSHDQREGMNAFAEKRKAKFIGE